MIEQFSVGKYNALLNNFRNNVRRAGRANIMQMTGHSEAVRSLKAGPPLSLNIKSLARKDSGEIYMVGFRFPRHGIFISKGVGRGWQMKGGSVVRVAAGEKFADREPKDWLNSEIDKRMPRLADNIVSMKADAVVNVTRIKIN